ncbi:MAG TPA: carboxylesterase/lipase family protein [Jatrophihabitans sp.]|nr:carboxylesterase/lipase family protein [Jatrophihabitans sp.]
MKFIHSNLRSAALGTAVIAAAAIVLTVCASSASSAQRPQPERPALVHTDHGWVRAHLAAGVRRFEGIPYAAPPTGNLRFRSPRPATPWRGVLDADRPGPACAQLGGFPGDAPSNSEDCLYLNVTAPAEAEQRRLPVMVWIHGDGFFQSSGGIYGADRLVRQGRVIVVTFNYRLGALGFLAHPALDRGTRDLSGNFGLEDQQAALRWVRDNAAAFGGDPHKVTIFGESAGGMSVCAHLAAPRSAGLFQRAIIMSGPCTLHWPYSPTWGPLPRRQREAQGVELAKQLGCTDAATAARCLRALPVKKLINLGGITFGPGPTVGGGVLPVNPARAFASGQVAHVPVMQGTTRDEHVTFIAALESFTGQSVTRRNYPGQVATVFGKQRARAILARYPLTSAAPARTLASVLTDSAWTCPALATDRLLATHLRTFAYEFADRKAPWFRDAELPKYPTGAYHASELQYLFSGAYASEMLDRQQRALSRQMIAYWTRFARKGSPNGPGTPRWPQFHGSSAQSLATGTDGVGQVDLGAAHNCAFWSEASRPALALRS